MSKTLSESEGRALFPRLRTLCVQVMSAPSLETLTQLRDGLNSILGCRLLHPHMIDYVILPVKMVISKSQSTDLRLLEGGLETLETVLCHVRGLDKWEVFHNLLVPLCMLLDTKMAMEAGFAERSEDLVLLCIQALRALLLSPSDGIRQTLVANLPVVGHCVSVLLDTLQSFSSKTLRQHTLSTLLALTGVDSTTLTLRLPSNTGKIAHDDIPNSQEASNIAISGKDSCVKYLDELVSTLGVGQDGCGRTFASFLPGISMAIAKLVTSDTNLGTSVTMLCLLTWAHYVAMVMNDSECSDKAKSDVLKSTHSSYDKVTESNSGGKKLDVQRSLPWQQETDSRLCVLIQRMTGLVTSEGWRARLAVVSWTHILLSQSYRTLTTSTPHLLEALVILSHDDYPLISHAAYHVISTFSKCYDSNQSYHKLTSLLEGRVHSLCSALPRLMRQNDDKRKMVTLQLLSGYLRLLGSHVTTLTHSHAHLSRLIMALVQTLEVQVVDTRIVEQLRDTKAQPILSQPTHSTPPSQSFPDLATQTVLPDIDSPLHENIIGGSTLSKLALCFTHFREERIESLLYETCRLLGCHGNLQVVIDHLMDLYQSLVTQRKELLLILSKVLGGIKNSGNQLLLKLSSKADDNSLSSQSDLDPEQLYLLVKGVALELVESADHYHIYQQPGDLWAENKQPNQQDCTLLSCLKLDTLLTCARVLKTSFTPLLQQLAYPLLQWLGDTSVSPFADGVVHSIAVCCGYRSTQELISCNADYLVNNTALELRNPSSLAHHLQATHVMQAILTHGDETVLPLIHDSLDELLFSLDARRQSPAHIWPTLHSLSEKCRQWSSLVTPKDSPHSRNLDEELKDSFDKKKEPNQEYISPENIKQFFLNYHKHRDSNEEDDDHKNVEEHLSEVDDPYTQKQELSPVTQAAVSVMQRCTHHLSSRTQQVQLLTLEALANCILALKYNQTTLLPEVHDVWSSFLPRLSDPSPPVAMRAWKVMLVMCEICGGFLRKRVVAKVWPPLIKLLETLAPKSINADPLYRQTSHYKLQKCLLSCVSTLCIKLEVSSGDMESLARSSLPYLSTDQPQGLQEACIACLGNLIGYDPDTVWLLLQQLSPESVPIPPNIAFKQLAFKQFKDSHKFVANVQQLLPLCE